VAQIPRAQGEDQDAKVARIARYAGVSRATLYNILRGQPTRLVSVSGWIRLLKMIPEGRASARREHIQKVLQVFGCRLEGAAE